MERWLSHTSIVSNLVGLDHFFSLHHKLFEFEKRAPAPSFVVQHFDSECEKLDGICRKNPNFFMVTFDSFDWERGAVRSQSELSRIYGRPQVCA